MPGFDSEAFPFVLARDAKALYILDCKVKHRVFKVFSIGGCLSYDNRVVMWDEQENLKILTFNASRETVILQIDKCVVEGLKTIHPKAN